jgi:hypothetical protein
VCKLVNRNGIADTHQASDIDDPNTSFSDQNDYETMPNFEVLGEKSPLARLERTSQGRMPLSVSSNKYWAGVKHEWSD